MRGMATRVDRPGAVRARPIVAVVLAALTLFASCGATHSAANDPQAAARKPRLKLAAERSDQFLDELQERTFKFFWELANPTNGLVPDRWPDGALPLLHHRRGRLRAHRLPDRRRARLGHARARPRERVARHAALLLDRAAGHGAGRQHRLPRLLLPLPRSRTRARASRTSSSPRIDTALLLAGALFCQSYFDRADRGGGGDPRARRFALPRASTGAGPQLAPAD